MSKKMQEDYLDLLDFTKGLYEKALQLLQPGSDDMSILSGAILLTTGLEKLIKYVLYIKNPLMILYKKIEFDDFKKLEEKDKFDNCKTISIDEALKRLIKLYPKLNQEVHNKDLEYIIGKRNYLMHNFGYINILELEKKIQTKIADISESICKECLAKNPEDVFTENTWTKISSIRDAYKHNIFIDIENKIELHKRFFNRGEKLSCQQIEYPDNYLTSSCACPVCNNEDASMFATFEYDIDFDHRENATHNYYEYLDVIGFKCNKCDFTLSYEEVHIFFKDTILDFINTYFEEKNQDREDYEADILLDEYKYSKNK